MKFTAKLLLAAASEAKKNALMAKYEMDHLRVNMCANIDTTPNGQYTEWLCRELKHTPENFVQLSDERISDRLYQFNRLKNSPEFKEACARVPKQYHMDIMKYDFYTFFEVVAEAEHLVSKKQKAREMVQAALIWTGEFEGLKIEVFRFGKEDGEAYSYMSGGPSLSRDLNPSPETSWCTVEKGTASDYLWSGEAYIIRVDGKNYCNINEASQQCMDASNHPISGPIITDPIVSFAMTEAPMTLTYYKVKSCECHQCHNFYGDNPVADTRYGHEGENLCLSCFHKDWTSETKHLVSLLYSMFETLFVEEPTTTNVNKWVEQMWEEDSAEHEHNFWTLPDVADSLKTKGVVIPKKQASLNPRSLLAAVQPKLSAPSLQQLAEQFAQTQNFDKVEGRCAELARAFSQFLTEQHVTNRIVDARDYKGPLKSVGGSNHVLCAVGDNYYVDFTAKQFDPSAKPLVIGSVSSLKRQWGVVNLYSSYEDFLTNFSRKQKTASLR